ncbi:MAG: glutamine-hydrolyzing GMP synthase [Sedimentisphaerales bacterium]|nr:glutamine-hydrolyzing GMP synthase [Sedimentisphaerales bacterium]
MSLKHDTIAILDFGSQYGQLIARRVREHHVYSELLRHDMPVEQLKQKNLKGIILSGGPASVYADGAPKCDSEIFKLGVPVLGICYGMQIGCNLLGANVDVAHSREYGSTKLQLVEPDALLAHLSGEKVVWMSHGDQVNELPDDFMALGKTGTCPFAAVRHKTVPFFGVQFHPEVTHTPCGTQIFQNFLYEICGCKGDWKMGNFIEQACSDIQAQVGKDTVICGLSGGVDSSVVAALLHRAIGKQLTCIFVDNGLLRKGERDNVESTFRDHFQINLRVVDWSERFLTRLAGVTDPQQKRRIIGHEFIEAFRSQTESISNARFLAQGTLYPDVIESGHKDGNPAANIKLHHNVGGLPEELGFELVEPLRDLFKDEVRILGEHLGLSEQMVWRHPFPGPGLAVRIVGEITKERLAMLQEADAIAIEEITAAGLYKGIGQALTVLLPISSVGVMGDDRSYENQHVAAFRAVDTTDYMTADWTRIPYEVLARISNRIINEIRGINRVVYDISSKPPATIEWE